jgi:hypothetical protein
LNPQEFSTLLQFLVYAQTLNYRSDSLGNTRYRLVQFRVRDFLKYKKESSNYFQLKKLIQFFDELQENSLIKFFSDKKYRSLVTIPQVTLEKGKQNSWFAEVWIAEDLFYYVHPFVLPDLFQTKLTKHQFQVQFYIIQTFSSVGIQKTFYLKKFLQAYPSTLTNQEKAKIKRYFIKVIKMFEEHQLIKPSYQVILKDKSYHVEKLTPNKISEAFTVFEQISL